MANTLGYDEFKDHPLKLVGGYGGYSADQFAYYMNPANTAAAPPGLLRIFSNPNAMMEYTLQNPAVADSLRAYQNYQSQIANANAAQRTALNRQRAAAAEQRAIEKKRLQFMLDTGLRDNAQATEDGLQAAINDSLQRGIYKSGIRLDNEAEVAREGAEGESDLRTEIQLALDALAAQGKAQDASFAGSSAALAGQAAISNDAWITPDDIFAGVNAFASSIPSFQAPNIIAPPASPTPARLPSVTPNPGDKQYGGGIR